MESYFEHYQYSATPLNHHVWHIQDATLSHPPGLQPDGSFHNPSSVYLIVDKNESLVIDLGNPYDDTHLREMVNHIIGQRSLKVALTHHHFDHVGALCSFQDCLIYIPEHDPVANVKHAHIIKDKDIISLDRFQFEVIHAPGHTKGSVIYYERQNGWLATGDAFGSSYVWLLFMPDVLTVYQQTLTHVLDVLKGHNPLLFLCGHRYQQQITPVKGIHPLSPKNPHMDIGYLEDMLKLTKQIKQGKAKHHEFKAFDRDDLIAYTYKQAEIDTYLPGSQEVKLE